MNFMSLPGIAALIGTIGAIFAGINGFMLVHEGEQGLLKRFGSVKRKKDGSPLVLEKGWRLLLPWAFVVIKRSVRLQSITLAQQLVTKKGLTYSLNAAIYFTITDIYKALIDVTNLDDYMRNVGMSIVQRVIAEMEETAGDSELTPDSAEVSKKITEEIQKLQGIWGVDISSFAVISFAPSSEAQHVLAIPVRAATAKIALLEYFGNIKDAEKNSVLAAAIVGIPVSTTISN